jgi:hypothetical protein
MGIEAAIIGSALVGGAASMRGASKAAKAQQQAAQQAAATEERMLERQLAETAPFRELSLAQLNRLAALYGPEGAYTRAPGMEEIQMDPGYAFRLAEGQKALERSAAARGGLLSGTILKGTQRFGQGLASQEFASAYERARQQRADVTNALLGIGGYGPSLASSAASAMGQTGANIANIQMGAGQARASGYLGQANALAQALGQGAMGYGLYKGGYFDRVGGGYGGGAAPGYDLVRPVMPVAPSRGYVPGP